MRTSSVVARLWSTKHPDAKPGEPREIDGEFDGHLLNLNLRNYGVGLEVKGNNSIRYIGNGSHSTDVGAIQTNQPVPSCASVYYYELTVLEKGERGYVSLGFADRAFKLNRQCGWENNSYGYHGDDGKKYSGSGLGTHYGPTFTTGDVVGAGLHTETNDVFFTKNGEWLGVAFRDVSCVTPLYPTVGLHSKDERVSTNFGSAPFAFDIETYVSEEKSKRTVAVAAEDMPASVTHELVRDYLNYHGYAKTLRALDDAAAARGGVCDDATTTRSRVEPSAHRISNDGDEDDADNDNVESETSFDLRRRAHIHSLILAGNVDTAEEHLRDVVFKSEYADEVRLHLTCQRYVEIIRAGDFANALEYAQSAMPSCVGLDPSWDEVIRSVMALVAYDLPGKSPLSPFLTPAHRDRVADAVNAAVLAASHFQGETTFSEVPFTTSLMDDDDDDDDVDDDDVDDVNDDDDDDDDDVEKSKAVGLSANSRGGPESFAIPAIGAPTAAAVLGLGSRAEVLLRQLFISAQELRTVNGGKGEVFELVRSGS